MKKLVGIHAEDVGGLIVEPGQSFDESTADADAVKRLTDGGAVIDDTTSTRKPTKATTADTTTEA